MSRPRAQQATRTAADVTFQEAHRWEESRWPDYRLRGHFWRRPVIPSELREGAGPDPRMVLGGEAGFTRFRCQSESFHARRLAWLASMAED